MLTRIMKWVCIAGLLLAALRIPTGSYLLVFEVVVCMAGLLAATQAVRAGRYFWATGFVAIAVLFNPVVPAALARRTFLWLDLVCLMTFLISLGALRTRPTLSIPSITGRTPGSESL
jgi:hypothetical protein